MRSATLRSALASPLLAAALLARAGQATYVFNNNLNATGGGPSLAAVNSGSYGAASLYGAPRSVYNTSGTADFAGNAGLTLNAASILPTTTQYSLEMVVAVADTTTGNTFKKLADVSNRSLDTGYYTHNSHLNVFNVVEGTAPVTSGAYNYLVLTVNAGTLKGYVNGALDFTYASTTIMDGNAFSFFLDDSATGGGEYSNVSVGLLRLRDSVLSDNQIAALAVNPYGTVPEPSTFAALGLGSLALLRRRKRA